MEELMSLAVMIDKLKEAVVNVRRQLQNSASLGHILIAHSETVNCMDLPMATIAPDHIQEFSLRTNYGSSPSFYLKPAGFYFEELEKV